MIHTLQTKIDWDTSMERMEDGHVVICWMVQAAVQAAYNDTKRLTLMVNMNYLGYLGTVQTDSFGMPN